MIRLLIVDDHDNFRQVIRAYLEKSQLALEIYEAVTGEMAVTKAACIKPDIVLMDLSLPGENGFEASRQIKQDNPGCDVIIVTMFEAQGLRKIAETIAADFVGKGEIYERLIPSIQRCLEKKNRTKPKQIKIDIK